MGQYLSTCLDTVMLASNIHSSTKALASLREYMDTSVGLLVSWSSLNRTSGEANVNAPMTLASPEVRFKLDQEPFIIHFIECFSLLYECINVVLNFIKNSILNIYIYIIYFLYIHIVLIKD